MVTEMVAKPSSNRLSPISPKTAYTAAAAISNANMGSRITPKTTRASVNASLARQLVEAFAFEPIASLDGAQPRQQVASGRGHYCGARGASVAGASVAWRQPMRDR